ncbi:1-deoxy-D-xylulose-5-phosphate synthase [Streptomyces sp. SID13031]|uniref:1-deoxy-D-xylulose-5-phosphate synthase n=1 Tax=Streptomyces sp. SID13031 TaxID=2706046 RepID=UPI0013CB712C|nr:1-deoxy-D-xylulose-5-phosphate synthase [Streptomyces sp. SID13031]NEA36905.1 1-deoxy-D-xylulose-5-phosphate synthase [Streptomyces sp. SID13031]
MGKRFDACEEIVDWAAGCLSTIREPADVRRLGMHNLLGLAAEIREFLVASVSASGGHLGPNLGVVELTLALHRVFDSPFDTILWDTGHQAYVHKLLTGRREKFGRLRAQGGLSGYPSRSESPHDVIENSHASVSLAYADGLAKARQLRGEADRRVACVIGDGALTGGVAWEALNNLGAAPELGVIVVVNDNGRSYAPTVGGVASHLHEVRGRRAGEYQASDGAVSIDGTVFTALGLDYIGPVDGHDLASVESALRCARGRGRSVVVHCVTQKGRGYGPAEADDADCMHGPPPFDPSSGAPRVSGQRTWTSVFGAELVDIAATNRRVVAITAAMPGPVGLVEFGRRFPKRIFDVGIAEQHAVASAAGLAIGGLHPVVCLYSTFLNRAFDQVLLDVALHRCGVTFVLDRAGITGDDGPSHNGMWDMSLLQLVPGLRLAAPRDGATLREELREAIAVEDGPTAVRFPKGAVGADIAATDRVAGIDVLRSTQRMTDVLIVSVGAAAQACLAAADQLAEAGTSCTVVDPRWVKPINPALATFASGARLVVTVEDSGRTGGVGAALSQALRDAAVWTPMLNLGIPQRFLSQGTRSEVLTEVGLTAQHMAQGIADTLAGLERQAHTTPPITDGEGQAA